MNVVNLDQIMIHEEGKRYKMGTRALDSSLAGCSNMNDEQASQQSNCPSFTVVHVVHDYVADGHTDQT